MFWSAEEFGLLGSTYYVSQLNQTTSEIREIRACSNFDMIASPNFVNAIYDRDSSSFNLSGPPGSPEIEADFQGVANGVNYTSSEFSGRSNYGAFWENKIPARGFFTSAEEVKTEAQALAFGGSAGTAYDENYHQAGDTIDNLAHDAFLLNTQSIANSVALHSTAGGLDRSPPVTPPSVKRHWQPSRKNSKREVAHAGHTRCNARNVIAV